ncbi:TIM barrel protein [Lentisphaera araneosa]|nr:TIM barrel protein [Lentisphaera araneosa]
MEKLMYPDLPDLNQLPNELKQVAQRRKISNLLLNFLDFYISEEAFCELHKNDFEHCNLPETIQDLKFYGYEISMPESAAQYRSEVFPLLMDVHAKAGYYGVQVPAGGIAFDQEGELTEEAVALVKQQVKIIKNAGLAISTVGGSWDADWTQCIKPQAQAAKLMGSKFLYGPFSTPFLLFPENCYGEAAVKWLKQQHNNFHQTFKKEIGPYLKSLGVIMCEEPLQRFERMPAHLKECTELALREGMEQFSVMIDTCHEFADGAGPEAFRIYVKQLAVAGKLNGAHISALHRGKIYESWFNQQFFNEFFGPLFEQGFEGEIAIETFDATQPVVEVAKVNREKFKHPIGVLINQLHYACEMIKDL